MERLFGKWGLWVLIILVEISGYNSCFEEERMGLLEVKAFFKSSIGLIQFEDNLYLLPRSTRIDADNLLPTWIDGRESESCCDWERVTCNHATGHVVELALDNIQDLSFYHYYDEHEWRFIFEELQSHTMTRLINASLFLPFEELQSLNLSFNLFRGWFENEGFERLSVLRKLEVLSLSFNGFNNSILSSLSALTSLKRLNLQANKLNGSFPADELAHLQNLEMLDLSNNGLANTSTKQGCDSLSRLKKLQTLSLGYNNFNQSIILCLSALTSLTNLNLVWNWMGGFFPIEELSVLKNLKVLNLGSNGLEYSPKAEDSTTLSKLTMLRNLDLSVNSFNNSIILSLLGAALPSLKFLSLARNGMEGQLHDQGLASFHHLQVLDLSNNRLVGSIPPSIGALSSLKALSLAGNQLNGSLPANQGLASFHHLQVLDLSSNGFVGSIPPSIGALSSLKALSLAHNQLNGSLPANQGLCELKELRELELSSNSFEGIIPPCLNSLTNLRLLDLSVNQFTGNVSSSPLRSLTSLEYIDLSHNRFGGLFSFSSLANHSNLEVVEFISDNEQFEIETEDSNSDWVPLFQLKVLVLSNCNLNKLSHDIPNFLLHQHELSLRNSLQGSFPNWLIDNNTKLEILSLRNNSFIGQFLPPTYRNVHTSSIDVSGNLLSGQIQKNIGEMLPYIRYLNLSRNTFEGTIPISFGNMSLLDQLDLSVNKLSGEVPYEVVAGCTRLSILNLSANRFRGKIFSTHFNLYSLWVLHLENNCFTGTLSDVIFKSSELYVLDVGNNCMSGEIPSGIGNLTSLGTLILRNNSFKGRFPFEHVPLDTSFLDLSHNSFLGSLPSCSNLNYVEHMHLQGNKFTGSIPKCFVNSSHLLTLDMRDNNLSGIIPPSVGALSNLRILLLGGNHFFGLIPNHLCQLSMIGIMDLSRNSFSGFIPNCFHNISFGKIYNTDFTSVQTGFIGTPGLSFYSYASVLQRYVDIYDNNAVEYRLYSEQVQVEFVTKHLSNSYKGDILNLMSGLDLSCNNITGEIPPELGNLSSILALNLSHNHLTGPIPNTFSDLANIESLDLSYNNLSGVIPSELIDLNFLEVFSVAHNNLSGRIPDRKAQFGTFEVNSYEGNPFLCGQMIEKTCTPVVDAPYVPPANLDESDGKWYEIDPVVFSSSFSATYVMILLGFAAILYINPHWRRRWFYFIEELIYSFYYFVCDLFSRRSGVLCFLKNK